MLILQIFSFLQSVLAGTSTTQTDIGCLKNNESPCTKLCPLGVEDCSSTLPKCEYGYFLFSLGASTQKPAQCVQCPYFYVNIRTDLVNYCMDCYEDPYGWEFTRKCTYDYEVGNGEIETGAYQKKTRQYSELFFVGSSTQRGTWTGSITRTTKYTYAVYICSGCASFCNDFQTNSDCYEMNHDYISVDYDKIAVTCTSGYFFSQNLCLGCSVKYCQECSEEICKKCENGYRLSSDEKSCIKCTNNCATCQTQQDSQICDSCESGYIISLDLSACETCSDGCLRCEYVSYDSKMMVKNPTRTFSKIDSSDKSYYIKQCRQCSEYGDTFQYDGERCEPCFITNCEKCYYKITYTEDGISKTRTTLELEFIPYNQISTDTTTDYLCFSCNSGFTLNAAKTACEADDGAQTKINCLKHQIQNGNYKCVLCGATYILDQTTGNCFGKCSDQIENCSFCFSYDSLDVIEYYDENGNKKKGAAQKLYQCIKCEDGFYPDFFSSKCLQCQSNCDTCSQYNLNYNFTDYVEQQIIENELTKSNYLTSELEDPFCSICQSGYQLYSNTCQGCTSNCVIENTAKDVNDPSSFLTNKCEFLTNGAFCGECFNSKRDRSLKLDQSECWQCPYMCKACRERTKSELGRVNLYFSPSNSILEKYSRVCYLYDPYIQSGNSVTFDTYLNMPIVCSTDTGKTEKCKKSAKIDVKLFCEGDSYTDATLSASAEEKKFLFNLQYFYAMTSSSQTTTNVTFTSLEDLTIFIEFNQNVVTELEFIIQLVSGTQVNDRYYCTFTQSTNFIFTFQKNVFSLTTFKVHIIGEQDVSKPPLILLIDGVLSIPQANYVIFEGIEIQSLIELTEKPYIGLNISDNAVTRLELNRFKIINNAKQTKMLFQIDNIDYMVWNKVEFSGFGTDDLILIQNPKNYINKIDYTFNEVTFYECYFSQKILFQTNSNTNIQSISIKIGDDGMIFNKCFLENTKIFGETDLSQQNSGSFIANKVVFQFTNFNYSNFVNYKSQNITKLINVDIIKCNFTNSSILVKSNSFNIDKLYVWKNYFYTNCRLFQTSYKVIDNQFASQAVKDLNFFNLKISDNICFSVGCFIQLSTPINIFDYQSNITFQNLLVENTDSIEITEKESNSVLSALFIITSAQKVSFKNFQALNNFGVTQLAVKDVESFILIDGLYDWTQDSYDAGRLLPLNNLIPTSVTCAERKVEFKSYNEHYLYLSDFDLGIYIENIVMRRLLSLDTIFIQIKSWDVEEHNSTYDTQVIENNMFYNGTQKEVIILKNIKVDSNSLVITESRSSISSIFIESKQEQEILIEKCIFTENHLHSLSTDQLSPSTPVLVIDSSLAHLNILSSSFIDNRATSVHYSIIYIIAFNISITSSTFENTNIRKQEWIYRLEEQQIITSGSLAVDQAYISKILEQFFPIESIGGNIYAKTSILTITSSDFMRGQALKGAGIYVETIEQGRIKLLNTKISNQFNSLLNEYQSNGGCLYIDSSNSEIYLEIKDVLMDNCVTRMEGGCIFLSPSTQSSIVYISYSTFQNCQGLLASAFSFKFSTSSSILPIVSISDCLIYSNTIANFLRNIPDLTTQDITDLQVSSTVLEQQYGRIAIDSTIFRQFSLISILYLKYMVEVQMNNVQINSNTIFLNSIVDISLAEKSGIITLTSSQFNGHTQFNSVSSVDQDCSELFVNYNSTNFLTQQTCDQIEAEDSSYRTNVLPEKLYGSAGGTFPLYLEEIETAYKLKTVTEKYILENINKDYKVEFYNQGINLLLTFSIYQIFDESSNSQFINCFYSNILNDYITTSKVGIIRIESVTQNQYLTLESISLTNNKCLRCVNGLMQIFNVHQETSPLIDITDLNCFFNSAGYYGCLMLTYASSVQEIDSLLPLTDYSLTNNRLLSVTDELLKQKNVIMIKQSNFISNIAKVGAGLSIIGLESLIFYSLFTDNYASLIGGALYYESALFKDVTSTLHISENIFSGNKAQLAGGMFISGGSIGNISAIQISFSNNQGQLRGDNLEEYPQSLTITMQDGILLNKETYNSNNGDINNDGFIDSKSVPIIDIIKIDSYSIYNYPNESNYLLLPSGQSINSYKFYFSETDEQVPYNWKFRIINLDRFKQPMSNMQKTETCTITGRIMDENNYNESKEFLSNFTNTQLFYYDSTQGVYNLDSLIVTSDPYLEDNLYLQLKFVCTSIKIPVYSTESPYSIESFNTNYALYLNIKTVPCQLGEAYSLQQCKACTKADKTYSVTEKQAQCQVMDSGTMDDVSPTGIKLKAGYWRPTFNSELITYCLNLPLNCNGGWTPGNPSCYTGHMGGLCESCDIYGVRDDPQAISAKYKCGPCADTLAVNAIVITALSLVTLVSMMLSVKGNYQMLEDFVKTQNRIQMGILVSPSQSNLAILIKLFTNYFQILSAISTFQINLSEGISNATQVMGNPTQSMSYSLDCFLVDMTTIDILYFRLIWALLMPLLYLATFLFGYFMTVYLKIIEFKEGIIYTAFIYMFLYLQPTLVGGFISLASSRTLSGISWVQADVLYEYDTDTHYVWLAGFVTPMLICWAFLLPSLFMFLVYNVRNKLSDFDTRKKLGYFYNEYTQEGYLWEFVKIFEKELIIIFLTFYEDRVVVKGLIIFLIVFFYGGFTIKYHPYQSNRLNFIDRLSTAICAASLCLGVLIYASIAQNLIYLEIIMLIIVALLNLAFIILMIYYLFEGYLIKFQPQLDKIRDQLRIHHPEIQEKYPWTRKMLYNQAKMNQKVKKLWAILRYQTRKGIQRKREDPNAPLFVNENIDQPILMPFFQQDTKDIKEQQTNNQQDSPNFKKIYPENEALNSDGISLNQFQNQQE